MTLPPSTEILDAYAVERYLAWYFQEPQSLIIFCLVLSKDCSDDNVCAVKEGFAVEDRSATGYEGVNGCVALNIVNEGANHSCKPVGRACSVNGTP